MQTQRPGKILIVEDQPLITLLARTMLIDAGFEVVGSASSAADAVAAAERTHPDIALMDIRLRGPGDGIGAAIEIRRRFDIPSIFASATIGSYLIERAAPAAPVAWLNKPYRLDELIATFRGFFDNRRPNIGCAWPVSART
jgi:CheY-like chemotaxis protein